MLLQHLAGRTTGLVFQTGNGTPPAKDNTRRILHSILKTVKIEKGGLHSFGHGRVSVLQANGVPGDPVKESVGPTSLRTTSGYTHLQDSNRQEFAKKGGLFSQNRLESGNRIDVLDPNEPNGPKSMGLDNRDVVMQDAVT